MMITHFEPSLFLDGCRYFCGIFCSFWFGLVCLLVLAFLKLLFRLLFLILGVCQSIKGFLRSFSKIL